MKVGRREAGVSLVRIGIRVCFGWLLGGLAMVAQAQVADQAITRGMNRQPLSAELRRLIRSVPPLKRFPNTAVLKVYTYSRCEVRSDGSVVTTVHQVYQVRKEKGKEEAGEEAIAYSPYRERVRLLIARTILPGSKVVNVQPNQVFDRVTSADYPAYPIERQIDFSFTEVKVGAFTEFKYEVVEFAPLIKGLFNLNFYLSDLQPCLMDVMELIIPRDFPVVIRPRNGAKVPPPRALPGNRLLYRWQTHYLQEIESEPYMPSGDEFLPYVEVAKRLSWEELHRWLSTRLKPAVQLPSEGQSLVKTLLAGVQDPVQKVSTLFEWVQENIRATSAGFYEFKPTSLSRVLRERYANEIEASILLCAMLRFAGIQAELAFADSGADYEKAPTRKELPNPYIFDSCLVAVNLQGQTLWLDPLTRNRSVWERPTYLEGCEIMVLSDQLQWVRIEHRPKEEVDTEYFTQVRLQPDGSAEIEYRLISHRDEAVSQRSKFRKIKPRELEEEEREFIQSYSAEAKLIEHRYSDWRVKDQPFEEVYRFYAPNWALKVQDVLVIYPGLDQSLSRESSNPFTRSKRRFPIVFDWDRPEPEHLSIELPDGFEILDLPEPVHINNNFLEFFFDLKREGRVVRIKRWSRYKSVKIPPAHYQQIKAFFDRFDEIYRRLIVLREKR